MRKTYSWGLNSFETPHIAISGTGTVQITICKRSQSIVAIWSCQSEKRIFSVIGPQTDVCATQHKPESMLKFETQ